MKRKSKSKPVHIEGMGVIGSILAWHLHSAGQVFTWSDIDTEVNAWEACTGIIYPSGHPEDMGNP